MLHFTSHIELKLSCTDNNVSIDSMCALNLLTKVKLKVF